MATIAKANQTSAWSADINNGLSAPARDAVASHLNDVLDGTYGLLIRTHLHHWNVEGPLFESLHKLLEAQYTALFAAVDEIAERVRALGSKAGMRGNGFPQGTVVGANLDAHGMMADLLTLREALIIDCRKTIAAAEEARDVVTADLLTGFIAAQEKDAWMLRALAGR